MVTSSILLIVTLSNILLILTSSILLIVTSSILLIVTLSILLIVTSTILDRRQKKKFEKLLSHHDSSNQHSGRRWVINLSSLYITDICTDQRIEFCCCTSFSTYSQDYCQHRRSTEIIKS